MGCKFYFKSICLVTFTFVLLYLVWNESTIIYNDIIHVADKSHIVKANAPKLNILSKSAGVNTNNSSGNTDGFIKTNDAVPAQANQIYIKRNDNIESANTTTITTTTFALSKPTKAKALGINVDMHRENAHIVDERVTVEISTVLDVKDDRQLKSIQKTQEIHHVAFLKVHKTGSSTLQNIFLRFGDSRNLTFVLGHDNKMLSESRYPNMISYSNSLNDGNIVPPPPGRHHEILCCHVIYNRTQFEKYLPPDSKYIGIVREPVARLESAMRYFNIIPNVSLSDFADNPLKYDKGKHSMANNRMAFEFGFPLTVFPNHENDISKLQKDIEMYLTKISEEFDFIIVNERMDECLVYMKRLLGWQMKDILYRKQLVAKKYTRRFTDDARKKLKSFIYLDFALYKLALDKLEEIVEREGGDFIREVEYFKEVLKMIEDFCGKNDRVALSIEQSEWSNAFDVTQQDCRLYRYFEMKYIQDLRMKQYGTLNN